MIDNVDIENSTYADPPHRFEAGTPPIAVAPEIVIEGASEAKIRYPDVQFTFFGDEKKVWPFLKRFKKTKQGI